MVWPIASTILALELIVDSGCWDWWRSWCQLLECWRLRSAISRIAGLRAIVFSCLVLV